MTRSTNDRSGHLIRRRLWVPLFMMGGISLLSGTAGPQVGSLSFTGMDKVGHVVVFALLGMAWARCLRPAKAARGFSWLLSVALSTGFGLLDELHQYTNPLRLFEWGDLLADFLGACIGAALYLRVEWLRRFLERPIWKPFLKERGRAPIS